jgi:NADPH-dependent FMN reductase
MSLRCVILDGSVRQTRQGIKAARFVVEQLARRGHTTTLVDPLERPLPLLDRMYKEYPKGEAPAILEALAETYRRADAFVIVSGEYNNGIPPALKKLARPFSRRVFFPAVGDRLLFRRRLWRCARGDAVAHDLGRAWDAKHPVDFPDPSCSGRI